MITAQYETKCPGCGEWIEYGESIGRVDGEWICQPCVDDAGGEDPWEDER